MDLAGRNINGYHVLSRLSGGEFFSVWKGVYPRAETFAALKAVNEKYATDKSMIARIQAEFDLCMPLHHEGLASYIDFGFWKGLPLLTMGYVDGTDLSAFLTQQSPAYAVRLEVMRNLLAVVGYLHENGIAHGNLCPDNVLVGASQRTSIIDLFYAEKQDERAAARNVNRVFPPVHPYLSPERQGKQPPSTAADIYALGLIFFHLFTKKTPSTTSVINPNQLPPIEEFCPEADPGLDKIVKSLLANEVSERPQDALEALRRFREAGIL